MKQTDECSTKTSFWDAVPVTLILARQPAQYSAELFPRAIVMFSDWLTVANYVSLNPHASYLFCLL
jgi:hypothetical protein